MINDIPKSIMVDYLVNNFLLTTMDCKRIFGRYIDYIIWDITENIDVCIRTGIDLDCLYKSIHRNIVGWCETNKVYLRCNNINHKGYSLDDLKRFLVNNHFTDFFDHYNHDKHIWESNKMNFGLCWKMHKNECPI